MKLSPTLTIGLVLAAGIAGAAVAQTAMTPGSSTSQQGTQTTAQPTPTYGAPSRSNPSAATHANGGQAQNNEQVRTAQQRLRTAGLYNGPETGLMDPDTMAAIKRFQQQHGLKQTSMLDQPTLNALMGSGTMGSGSTGQASPTAPTGAGGATSGQPTGQPTPQAPSR